MVKLDWFEIFICALLGSVVLFCFYDLYQNTTTTNRWFKECVADGHKEYECAPIMRRGATIGPKGIPLE